MEFWFDVIVTDIIDIIKCTLQCAMITLCMLPLFSSRSNVEHFKADTQSSLYFIKCVCFFSIFNFRFRVHYIRFGIYFSVASLLSFKVQDFRFLCPNGTAFDQEAQTCADWGDVDCESATLYYGSDNFDLYRIGSGYESKRAPLADEEESTFHLQRAESSKYYVFNNLLFINSSQALSTNIDNVFLSSISLHMHNFPYITANN